MATVDRPGPEELGRRLRIWRLARGQTQASLGKELGYTANYINKVETGKRPASRALLARWSTVTGRSEETLRYGTIRDIARPALPQPPGPLVGRNDALCELVDLLGGPARCVTLVGPPGVGKTRLAMAAALELDGLLGDGVWWVPLFETGDAREVGHRVLRALDIPDRGSSDPVAPVLERLIGQQALLVLDNFEHVLDAKSLVSRIVEGSEATVLVTSRAALRLESEHVFPVPPLSFPDPATTPSFDQARTSPAVELFVARAQMARPRFRLTPSNYSYVLSACARRDGIPLGIVLAAGGLKTLDPAGLALRMRQRLDLPALAPSDLPEHHARLEAAISWSWNLLSAEERPLFDSLAAFSGGFTAAAVAAVCGLTYDDAEALLRDFADKSLIEARPEAQSGPRFEMLETLRAYAMDHLIRFGRFDEDRERHMAYYASVAQDCGRGVLGPHQADSTHAFRDEFENLACAFEWALAHHPPVALTLAGSLWRCFLVGNIPTGRQWLADALAAAVDLTPARAAALAGAGALAWITGEADAAERYLAEAEALAAELGLDDVRALVRVNQAALAEQQSRLDDAEDLFTSALPIYEGLGDRRGRAVVLNGLGMFWRRQGEIEKAWPLWTEAASLFRAVGDGINESIALGNKAWAAEMEDRLDEAEELSMQCRRIQVALGDARGLAATTSALGRIAFRRGNLDEARSLQRQALSAFQPLGDLPWVASTLLGLAAIAGRSGSHDHAVRLLGAAMAVWNRIGAAPREEERTLIDDVAARCRTVLGDVNYDRAMVDGRALTVAEAATLADRGPAMAP